MALQLAHDLHRKQSRKQSSVPYIAHLMAVSAMVLEHGGNENQAIAALLHDGPEDQGGESTLARISLEFGKEVAKLVHECTEPLHIERSAWKDRKLAYLEHLSTISSEAALIAGCDKLHNARCLLAALEADGDRAFERFNGKARGTRWWYRMLAETLGPRLPDALRAGLASCAAEIEMQPRLPVWCRSSDVRLQTSPQRYWQLSDMVHCEACLPRWPAGGIVSVSGGGPMFLTAFLGARAGRLEVARFRIEKLTKSASINVEVTQDQQARSSEEVARMRARRLSPHDVLIDVAPGTNFDDMHLADTAALATAEVIEGDNVIVTGPVPVALAAAVAFLAVGRGADTVRCVTPPDGMSMCEVHGPSLGRALDLPEHVKAALLPDGPREALTFGIVGFPNSGKSVLTKLLGVALLASGTPCWTFEADPASPTPWWYVQLQREQHALANQIRMATKVDWSDELHREVARRLRNARPFFDRVIVDLPGGDMENPSGPQPIPPGREDLFKEVDRFIILRRADREDRTQVWIDALKQLGLSHRVHAVLVSDGVYEEPRLTLDVRGGADPWRKGVALGLDRDADYDAARRSEEFMRSAQNLLGLGA